MVGVGISWRGRWRWKPFRYLLSVLGWLWGGMLGLGMLGGFGGMSRYWRQGVRILITKYTCYTYCAT